MFNIVHKLFWGILLYSIIIPIQSNAQAQPTKKQAIACVTNFITEVEENGQDIRTFALEYIHIPSVSAIVARKGFTSSEAQRRVQETLQSNQSVAFHDIDINTIVYLRSSRVLSDPLRGQDGRNFVYRLNAYYYKLGDVEKEDRETFTLWVRVIPGRCQLTDLAWNNASLSWAAAR